MTKVYNTSRNNQTRKNEKNSEKEILDNDLLGPCFEVEEESEEFQGQWLTHLFSRNGDLSFACRGFLAFLFSHKPGFRINQAMIRNNVHNIPYKREKGKDYIKRLVKEAMVNGYLSIEYYIIESGKNKGLQRSIYKVHKKPLNKEMFARCGITDSGISPPVRIPISTGTSKEVVKKGPEKPVPPPKISPTATTSVSQKTKKKSLRRDITEEEISNLKLKYPPPLIDEKVKKVRETMRKYPKAFSSTDPYIVLVGWLEEATRKKAKTFTKKEDQMEFREQEAANAYQREEAQAKIVEKQLKEFIKINPGMEKDIIINETQRTVDLRDKINPRRFTTYRYTDPFFNSNFDKWITS